MSLLRLNYLVIKQQSPYFGTPFTNSFKYFISGSSCVFPFSYKGVTHYQCTYADSPVPWCATQVSTDGSVVTNMWGDCDMSQTSSCQAESLSISSCTATSGQQCVFPFRYKGVVYTQCTSIDQSQPWCSTSVTASGNHQKHFKQNGYVQGVTDTISLGGQKSA